jgi:hypothetical protein
MATTSDVAKKVSAMGLCEVLVAFVDGDPNIPKGRKALDGLMAQWRGCECCYTTIAPGEEVFWNGTGFVHERDMGNGDAVPWEEVFLPGYEGSVSERLRQKKEEAAERLRQREASAVEPVVILS